MDSKVQTGSIIALRKADWILAASGHGSQVEPHAARAWGEEGEDVAAGGDESLVPQEDLEFIQPPDPHSYDPAINQFLAVAPSKPEVLGKDAWPAAVQIPKQLTA
jgi:hypothetical protein